MDQHQDQRQTDAPRWALHVQREPIGLHDWFVLGGLTLLADRGEAEIRWIDRALPEEPGLWMEACDRLTGSTARVCLDLEDQGSLRSPRRRALADLVWKRSWHSSLPPDVRPLGLVTGVTSGLEPRLRLAAAVLQHRGSLRSRRRALANVRQLWRRERRPPPLGRLEALPDDKPAQQTVLFQVRAWEPERGSDPEDRELANEGRAEIIRLLREELGPRFQGGFLPTEHARRRYPSLLTNLESSQDGYLRLLRRAAIGVSTVGLHGSNPYKLGEYLAAGTAIVSEPLRFSLPEPLLEDVNVCTFTSPEACVEACRSLLDDPARLRRMQHSNQQYWLRYAHPSALPRRRLLGLTHRTGGRHGSG